MFSLRYECHLKFFWNVISRRILWKKIFLKIPKNGHFNPKMPIFRFLAHNHIFMNGDCYAWYLNYIYRFSETFLKTASCKKKFFRKFSKIDILGPKALIFGRFAKNRIFLITFFLFKLWMLFRNLLKPCFNLNHLKKKNLKNVQKWVIQAQNTFFWSFSIFC